MASPKYSAIKCGIFSSATAHLTRINDRLLTRPNKTNWDLNSIGRLSGQ